MFHAVCVLAPTYFIHSAHAALSPWEGKNSLDAAVLAYNNISVLRQQLHPTHRVHGIIEGKDWAPNSKRNDAKTRTEFDYLYSYTRLLPDVVSPIFPLFAF